MRYVKKIQVFTTAIAKELEQVVNSFLSKEVEIGFHVIDIQYQTTCTQQECVVYSCMVYYSEPVEE